MNSQRNRLQTCLTILAATLLASVAVRTFTGGRISAQDFPAEVGRIEGDAVEVVTKTPAGMETDAAPTVVASGSDVTLRSGHALIMLNAGGEISVCGPAHFKVLGSPSALTLALDYGRVHPSLDSSATFTIYTPTVIATPIAIAGGVRDVTLGLEQSGEMCALTKNGAMRVEPQFADQSLIIPQGGTVSMLGGQIESLHGDASACSCEYPRTTMQRTPPPSAVPPREISALHRPIAPEIKKENDSPPPSASAEEPIYTVLMPPLTFDANSPAPPPDPDPETILLVREVRMRPTVVFRGHVNPAPPEPSVAPPARSSPPSPTDDRPPEPPPGILARVRNYFRKLTGWGPCAGAGCKD